MTIRKGKDWGEQLEAPTDLLVFADDPSADAYLNEVFANGNMASPIAVLKSNLARTLGLSGASIK